MSRLAPTLQAFFSDRLMGQRGASAHTIAAYRDTIRLLLRYAADRTHKQPWQLDIADLDAPLVGAFLDHLERDRHNGVRTRNSRLAAIHSLFRCAAYAEFGLSRVAIQGVDSGQSGIARAHAVAPLTLQVVQEAGDEAGVEVGDVKQRGRFVHQLRGEADQES